MEPYGKRTVEGDIGMRYGAMGIVEGMGLESLIQKSGPGLAGYLKKISHDPGYLPGEGESAFDGALAFGAVHLAVGRHAGTMESVYTPMGLAYCQCGKDLREVKSIILTGGALLKGEGLGQVLKAASFDGANPSSLKPKQLQASIDRRYILAAMGLLSTVNPEAALTIMEKSC